MNIHISSGLSLMGCINILSNAYSYFSQVCQGWGVATFFPMNIHIFFRFVKDGVNYSINTDDPVVLGNTLTDDYDTAREMGLSYNDIVRGVRVLFLF